MALRVLFTPREEPLIEELGLEPTESEGTTGYRLPKDALPDARARVIEALDEESALLQGALERWVTWVVENDSPGPKVVILVSDGFESNPLDFYRPLLGDSEILLEETRSTPSVQEMAQVLSTYGWLVIPFVPSTSADALLARAEEEDDEAQEGADKVDVIFQDGRVVDRTTVGFDPRKMLRKARERQEQARPPVLPAPGAVLELLAESTGGRVAAETLSIIGALERLPQRRRLSYLPSPDTDMGIRRVQIRAEETGAVAGVRARAWVSSVTPETVADVRILQMLEGQLDEGGLAVSAAVQPEERGTGAQLIIHLESAESGELPVRVSLAIPRDDEPSEVAHQILTAEPSGEDGDAVKSLILKLDRAPDAAVVVVVEDLSTGLWGGSYASVMESMAMASVSDPDSFDAMILPAPKAIHLMAPRQVLAMGPTRFETIVSDANVAQVKFFLEGQQTVVRTARPFTATLDMGPLPHPKRVEVVALDVAGRELGRDYMIVNEGSGSFGVRIASPRPDLDEKYRGRISGPIDVEAEVEPRHGQGIDRVEFFWMDTKVATRYAPPYRQRVVIPPEAPKGFLRVVAYLDDGASSEDVVFLNSPGSSAQLQVNLMEFYVVVTDRKGRPVKDLAKESFQISEQGEAQEIATFSEAGDLPLTVGLAIDSSASMFVKLPEVQFAAAEFLRSLATRRDRAFVVGFGDEPRLTRTATSDLPEIIASLDSLKPVGRTGIWKAIVYSLVQLQGVPGKKALIVYTDGADEDPDFSYRTTMRFARRVGVPIYIILSNNEIRRTEGKGLSVKGFLKRLESLTSMVGGQIYMARVGEDMQGVYQEIEEELRSQYVLGYYSEDYGGREWREVGVDVQGSGLKARTVAGYFR